MHIMLNVVLFPCPHLPDSVSIWIVILIMDAIGADVSNFSTSSPLIVSFVLDCQTSPCRRIVSIRQVTNQIRESLTQ